MEGTAKGPALAGGAGRGARRGRPALAPDGRQLLYPAAKDGVATLWLHDLSTGAHRELPGTAGAAMPFWSADQTRVGFFAGGKVRVLDLDVRVALVIEADDVAGEVDNGEVLDARSADSAADQPFVLQDAIADQVRAAAETIAGQFQGK